MVLGVPRRQHLARILQGLLNRRGEWVRAAEHAPRDSRRVPELPYGLAEIVERGGRVLVWPRRQWSCWQVASQYLNLHLTQRGALWASGAAQAAQFVRIILRFCGEILGLRRLDSA